MEAEIERPDEPGLWERLYVRLTEHEAQVRSELSEEGAEILYDEVRNATPMVRLRTALLYTVRAPFEDFYEDLEVRAAV